MTSNNTIHARNGTAIRPSTCLVLRHVQRLHEPACRRVEVRFHLCRRPEKHRPAGVVVAIIKDSLLAQAKEDVPVVLQYKTYVEHDSTYNTPPVFGIYFINKVMHWLEDNGGLEGAYRRNVQKAGIVYAAIDGSDGFYRGHAAAIRAAS